MSDELKPIRCGCGGVTKIIHGDYFGDDRTSVYCTDCGIQTCYYATEAEAITAWNRAMGITHEKAIDYLQASGWMKLHDKEMSMETSAERKKGKWIDGKPYVNSHWRVCSICHETSPDGSGNYNFCPHCGARLEWE